VLLIEQASLLRPLRVLREEVESAKSVLIR
jgi:hypothetical protein